MLIRFGCSYLFVRQGNDRSHVFFEDRPELGHTMKDGDVHSKVFSDSFVITKP